MSGREWLLIGLVGGLLCSILPAAAGELNSPGDGSSYNNPDLLRMPGVACAMCTGEAPEEWQDLPPALDWSISLRGSVTESGSGTRFSSIILPRASYSAETLRGGYSLGAEGEVSYQLDGTAKLDSLRFNGETHYRVDTLTAVSLKGSLGLSQDDPDAPGLGTDVAAAPLVVSTDGEASLTRDLGALSATLRTSAGRTTFGDTVYEDETTSANGFQNNTRFGVGSRLGVPVGPVLTGFLDTEANYSTYDEPSPSVGLKLDSLTYAVRAGLQAQPDEALEFEGSLGLAYRDFFEAALGDFTALLYDAKATFRPDQTVELTAALTTTVSSPGSVSGASGKVSYALSGEAGYQANPWLKLRGSAGLIEAHYIGVDNDEHGWSAGVGADYLLSEHMDATFDYVYSRSETTPAPPSDRQTVTVGLTIRR